MGIRQWPICSKQEELSNSRYATNQTSQKCCFAKVVFVELLLSASGIRASGGALKLYCVQFVFVQDVAIVDRFYGCCVLALIFAYAILSKL